MARLARVVVPGTPPSRNATEQPPHNPLPPRVFADLADGAAGGGANFAEDGGNGQISGGLDIDIGFK